MNVYAEVLQRLIDAVRTNDEIEIARSYYRAADRYVEAAWARLYGNLDEMERSVYRANSLIEEAELEQDWQVIDNLEGLRSMFAEMVECSFDVFLSEVATSDQDAGRAALAAFEDKCTEFKRRVREEF